MPSPVSRVPSPAPCIPSTVYRIPTSSAVRALFNHKARRWRSKYGPQGKLHARVEQFAARLAELCVPPGRILDLGCGTGEIAAALDQRGYRVTACDLAEEMMAVARRSHGGTGVRWVCLEPGSTALPFPDGSFDAIVASSVFEYLEDVCGTAAELARVLRPQGVMLLTVPNPHHRVRRIETWLRTRIASRRLPRVLLRLPHLDSYAAYLRLSRHRLDEPGWQAVLHAAHFQAMDQTDFRPDAWRRAGAPLVLLAVRKTAESPESDIMSLSSLTAQ